MGEIRNTYKLGKSEGKRPFVRPSVDRWVIFK
jgi:hypothetical protein